MFLPLEETIIISKENEQVMLFQWRYLLDKSLEGSYQSTLIIPVPTLPTFIYNLNSGLFGFFNLFTSLLKEREDDEKEYNGKTIFQKMTARQAKLDIGELDFSPVKLSQIEFFNSKHLSEMTYWLSINGYHLSDIQKEHINFYLQKNWYFIGCHFSLDDEIKKDVKYITLAPIIVSFPLESNTVTKDNLHYPFPILPFSDSQNICMNVYLLSKDKMKPINREDCKLLYANHIPNNLFLSQFFTSQAQSELFLTKFETQREMNKPDFQINFGHSPVEIYSPPNLVTNSDDFEEWLKQKSHLWEDNVNKDDEFLYIIQEFCLQNGRLPKPFEFKNLITQYYFASFSPYNPFTEKSWQNDGCPGDLLYSCKDDSFSIKFYDFWGNIIHKINGIYNKEELIKSFFKGLSEFECLNKEKIVFLLICKYFSEYPLKILGNDSFPTMAYIESFFVETITNMVKNSCLESLSKPIDQLWDYFLYEEFKNEIELKYSEYTGDNYIAFKNPVLSVILEESFNLSYFREIFLKIFTNMGELAASLEKTFLYLLGKLLLENTLKDRSGNYVLLKQWLKERAVFPDTFHFKNYPTLFYLYLLWAKHHFNDEEEGIIRSFEKAAIVFIGENWDVLSSYLQDIVMEYLIHSPSISVVTTILNRYENIIPTLQQLPFIWLNSSEFKYKKEVYADIAINYPKRTQQLRDILYNFFQGYNYYLQRQVAKELGNNYKQLPSFLQECILEAKNQHDKIEELMESAWIYYEMDLLNEALNEYQKIFSIDPRDASMHYGLGLVYAQLRQHDNAINEFKRAIEIDSTFASAYNNLGTIYKRLAKWENASIEYQKAITINPQKTVYYFNLGTVYHALAHKAVDSKEKETLGNKALELFKQAIRLDEKFSLAHLHLGNIYFEQENWELAETEYKDAIKNDTHNSELYFRLGKVYHFKKLYKKAVDAYNKALEIDPHHLGSLLYTGIDLQHQGQIEQAIEKYRFVLKNNPKYLEAYYHLTTALIFLNTLDEAEELCVKALSIDPKYLNIYNQLGIVYYKKKQYEKSIDIYKQALEIDPNYTNILNNLALVYDDMNNKEYALELYKKVIEIEPKNITVYNNMGFIYFDMEELDKAISVFKYSIEILPYNYDTYAGLGITYHRLGQIEDGIKYFQKAIEINSKCTDLEWLRTENFWNEKALAEANQILEKIKEASK